jgi:GNAT superfamily N-acetyltransferase
MQWKALGVEDGQAIADLHTKAFKSFFLTSLGNHFLKVFYQSIIKDPNGIAIGIFEEKQLVAFSVGTIKKQGFYSNILKGAAIKMLWAAIPQLVKDPKRIFRLMQSFSTKETTDQKIATAACLLSICVDPSMGNKGYGKKALAAFEQQVFMNTKAISLTTDADDNDVVNGFYAANGYLLLNEFYQSNRKMNLYYKNYEK